MFAEPIQFKKASNSYLKTDGPGWYVDTAALDSVLVPYTGADAAVNLGTQNLNTTGTVKGANVTLSTSTITSSAFLELVSTSGGAITLTSAAGITLSAASGEIGFSNDNLTTTGTLAVGTNALTINGSTLEIYTTAVGTSVLSIGKDRTGDGTDLGGAYQSGIGIEFFKNASNYVSHSHADNDNPSIVLYGATSSGQKHGSIGVDDYARLFFGGNCTSVAFSSNLAIETGKELQLSNNADMSLLVNTTTKRNGIIYITTAADSSAKGGALHLVSYGERAVDFHAGSETHTDPHFFVHADADTYAANKWISFYHNGTDGVIDTGVGTLNLDSADGKVNFVGATRTASTITHNAYVTLEIGGTSYKFMLGEP